MERNREARRGTPAAVNGLSRRRQRNSYRESIDEDGGMEMPEMGGRLRDRGSKRRRVDRHASNRDEAENSSEDSNNEEDDDEDASEASVPVRLPPPPLPPPPLNSGLAASVSHNHHRKSFPKAGRSAAAWKPADEMIGVPVPRKARSSSAKRPHEFAAVAGGGEAVHASPARPSPPSSTQILPSSSSGASARRKMKPIVGNGGIKHRPSKMSKSPSVSEDLEIEVAEVLFGLTRQFQSPSKPEAHKVDSKANGSSNEANSRVSSPISVSPRPAEPQPLVLPASNPSSSAASTIIPKRKRPHLARLEAESVAESVAVTSTSPSSSAAMMDSNQSAKAEAALSRLEKKAVCLTVENGTDQNGLDHGVRQDGELNVDIPQPSAKPQNNLAPELKNLVGDADGQDQEVTKQKVVSLSLKKCPPLSLNVNIDQSSVVKALPTEEGSRKTAKFSFDLMVPPLEKSSSDREGLSDYGSTDHKAKDTFIQTVANSPSKGEIGNVEQVRKVESTVTKEVEEVRLEARTANFVSSEVDPKKKVKEERNMDLQLDSEKLEKDNLACNKQHARKQPQKTAIMEHGSDKAEQSEALPMPMSVAGWPGRPGSFPPFGYMGQVPPLQAVTPGDEATGPSKPIQRPNFLSSDGRPKRCATHCYIAHNIYYHRQLSRINPFWHAAAGAPSPLYGPKHPDINAVKHYNLNAAPPSESSILRNSLQTTVTAKNLGPVAEKAGQMAASHTNHSTKENPSAGDAFAEAALRKQLLLPQPPQPGSVGNMLHGPAFIFPFNQQQMAAAAAAAHFGSHNPISGSGNAATSSNASSSVVGNSGASGQAMSFNYPVLPTNEAHYMSLLQNSGYPFPIPAHAGVPAVFKGGCTVQPVPFFNGQFYSSQMLPPQLQQHQQPHASSQQQPSNSHVKTGHQSTTSTSSGSSSSQKAPPQPQRAPGGGPTGILGTSQGLPVSKQQRQHLAPQCESGTESPSTADSRVLQAQKNIYGHNLGMAIHPQNYAFISPAAAAIAAASLGSGSGQNEKQQPTTQHQSMKVDLTTSQAFAMSFASAAAAVPPGMDFSSMAHSHGLFQNLPEATKHGYHIGAAAAADQASQNRKQQHRIAEDGKSTGDSTNTSTGEEERKTIAWGKSLANVPQHPVSFSRSDIDPPNATIPGNSVLNSSSRTLNLIQAPPANGNRLSNRPTSAAPATSNAPTASAPPNSQQQQQQQQQLIQLHKHQQHQQQQMLQMQHQFTNRSTKSSTPNNAAVYSDHLSAGSIMSKFPQALAGFPQSFLQNSGTTQSPQWKAANRATTPAPASSPATSSSKNQVAQQQGRSMQQSPLMPGHQTQISFGAGSSLKAAAAAGQQHPSGASSNPPLSSIAGMSPGFPQSPVAKTSGGSPRAPSSSKNSATHSHPAPLPIQQHQQHSGKNSPSSSSAVKSALSSSNAPSILGHPPVTASMSTSAKQQQQPQPQQQQQQQQMHKQQFPQALFFSNAYLQAQNSPSNGAPAAMYYHQRRPSEQQSQQVQQNSPSGGSSTPDPAKAASAGNMKAMAGMLQHPAQFGSPAHSPSIPFISAASGFPYIHGMPSASPTTKGSEQKPTGSDILHAPWQPEKK